MFLYLEVDIIIKDYFQYKFIEINDLSKINFQINTSENYNFFYFEYFVITKYLFYMINIINHSNLPLAQLIDIENWSLIK